MDFKKITEILNAKSARLSINKKELEMALDLLIVGVLFPICSEKDNSEMNLCHVHDVFKRNIEAVMADEKFANSIVDSFIRYLPDLQERLYQEAKVFYSNDPAANSLQEIIIAYPGFYALAVHRIAHSLIKMEVPVIPRLFSEYAHSKVGIDINPSATIGDSFYIDHGTGIVIGETTVIGDNVKIYQGVTLGALFVTKELSNKKRHPTIENNVVIYAGATILGGETVIGHDSIIGGNAWLTKSVPPYSQVMQNAEIIIREGYLK